MLRDTTSRFKRTRNTCFFRNFVLRHARLINVRYFKKAFLLLKYFVTLFLTDFIIRVFVNPKFYPTLIIGRQAGS